MKIEDISVRLAKESDKDFWFTLDRHLPSEEFDKKVRDGQAFVLLCEKRPAGILRYNLFWDNTPFCTMLYVAEDFRGKGLGTKLLGFWEDTVKSLGYGWLLVSTRSDETAQYFFRASGYADCGRLSPPDQPDELFLGKII
ncbi:MAG: GNAT family N-acetyltransferase [Corallococcus sp.]|nr:GNAT family N-acetyltransferase [Corallococcus sp.]